MSVFKISLITLCFMIFIMVLIGGLTRLTGSGLSIVEWQPITGFIPPLTHTAWLKEFAKYQQSPEFQKINFGMTLGEFQSIFFLEYIHRLWGRLIGLVLLVPTYLMIIKKQHRDQIPLLILLWILGMGQGVMGWIMVKSGLSHDPHVSPYRLSAHLLLGFAIFGVLLWMTLRVCKGSFFTPHPTLSHKGRGVLSVANYAAKVGTRRIPSPLVGEGRVRGNLISSLQNYTLIALALILLTAFFGALVAGHKAGLIYNTFPLMGETVVPREFLSSQPWWKDLLENPVSVQFCHRLCATITTLFCGGLWGYQRQLLLSPAVKTAFNGMMVLVLAQFFLGILTLLYGAPPLLALLHQSIALLVFGSVVVVAFLLSSSPTEPEWE